VIEIKQQRHLEIVEQGVNKCREVAHLLHTQGKDFGRSAGRIPRLMFKS